MRHFTQRRWRQLDGDAVEQCIGRRLLPRDSTRRQQRHVGRDDAPAFGQPDPDLALAAADQSRVVVRSNSSVMLAKSRPKVTMSSRVTVRARFAAGRPLRNAASSSGP